MSPATASVGKRQKVDLDASAGAARRYTAQSLPELLEEASREDLTPMRFLDRVLQQELERKNERRIATWLKLSGLPTGKTLEGFDWPFQPRLDRGKLYALPPASSSARPRTSCSWARPGAGKSHLAVALGVKAIKAPAPSTTS